MRAAGLPSLRASSLATGACAVTIALGLAGCAGTSSGTRNQGVTIAGSTLTIYASQPPGGGGQVAQDVFHAEQLAFQQSGGKVGSYQLQFVGLDRSEVSADARAAVSGKDGIAYIGEIDPGTSGVSAQITNELGLLQVSPTDTAAYLTQPVTGVAGSPQHFFPARKSFGSTFARVVPNTVAEATALAAEMKHDGVSSLSVTRDDTPYGIAVAQEVVKAAGVAGLAASTVTGTPPASAGAVLYAGMPGAAATRALDGDVAADPKVKLFGPSALYDDAFVSGLSAAAQKALTVSAPGFVHSGLDAVGQRFASSFAARYHHAAAPQAIFGYEAVRAVIAALQQAGSHANERSVVVSDFRALHRSATDSAVGAYAIDGGDTDLAQFVFATASNGALVPHAAG